MLAVAILYVNIRLAPHLRPIPLEVYAYLFTYNSI